MINVISNIIGANLQSTTIPTQSDALFWTDGIIIDVAGAKYFKGKKGSRNFLITNYDFDTTWDLGYPYKSAATISAPAGDAVLIAADINNFLYAGDGTPNQIPVVSLFQDIDYEHKLFCRHALQVLDSNGVETYEPRVLDIVLYANIKSGNDLTACQSYYGVPTESATAKWVSKTGNDGTGDGTKIKPYLTIEKAYKTFVAGTTVYVKSGVYTEEYNGTTIRYFYADKAGAFAITGLGRVEMRTISTTYVIRLVDGTLTLNRILLNGEGNTTNIIDSYPNNNKAILNKCKLYGSTSKYINTTVNAVINDFEINNCIFSDSGKTITTVDGCTIIGSYINGLINSVNKFNYNKCVHTSTTNHIANLIGANMECNYNTVSCANSFFVASTATSAQNLTAKYNNITFNWASAGTAIPVCHVNNQYIVPIIEHNTITSLTTNITDNIYYIYLPQCTTPIISNNKIISLTQYATYGVYVTANAGFATGKCTINGNCIKLNTTSGMLLTLGNETTLTGKFDNSEIIGNHFIGHLLDYPLVAGTEHGILLNAGINMTFANNNTEYCWLGLVIKTGGGDTYTSGGVYANIFYNNGRDIWCRKIKGLLIANNTLHGTSAYDKYSGGRIYIDSFDGFTSTGVLVKNNIISQESAYFRIGMDAAAYAGGCVISNSTISPNNQLVYNGSAYKTFAQATSDGVLVDCLNQNVTFKSSTEIWPIPAITGGEILSSPYNYILNTSTNWGSSTQIPIIILFNNTTGQIGAYGQ